jgi:phosphoserine phosphatase|tara:strand:+ start:14065 stop:14928 length:864 start_codon:yes stop_codon:yes gene_type:complete
MKLLWFLSDPAHLSALNSCLELTGLSLDAGQIHSSDEFLHPPSCDCFELIARNIDISNFVTAAKEVRTDFLWLPDIKPKLCLFDMDSTLIQQEVIDELAKVFGIGAKVSAITEQAMQGKLDFGASFALRLKLLNGLAEEELLTVSNSLTLMPGAGALTANLAAAEIRIGIVSGGFSFFADRIGAILGMNFVVSNALECIDGSVTGRAIAPIIDSSAKLNILESEASRLGISLAEVMAIGDGANDIPMLKMAGVGVAYHAKPAVQKSTNHSLNYQDLSALSYLVNLSS